jgi:predicted ABC-type ATPase
MSSITDRLDKETHDQIFAKKILPRSGLDNTTPQEKPNAIIFAGQPGAGKGSLVTAARKEFHNNIVIIDPDEQRDYYPGVKKLRETYPYTWSDHTHADASTWATELREAAIEGRRNIGIDTTLGNVKNADKLIEELQAKGYKVEIRAMAAHRLESELGVDQRFLTGVEKKGYGRYVPSGARDHVYSVLPENLDKIHANNPDLTIRIYNREGKALYNNQSDDEAPGQALTRIRQTRVATPEIIHELSEDWNAQLVKHKNLPETLTQNPEKFPPATAKALLDEREALNIVPEIERNARQANVLDDAVRPQEHAAKLAERQAEQEQARIRVDAKNAAPIEREAVSNKISAGSSPQGNQAVSMLVEYMRQRGDSEKAITAVSKLASKQFQNNRAHQPSIPVVDKSLTQTKKNGRE